MNELPIDIYQHLSTYLDCLTFAILSQCSKFCYHNLSSQAVWKKRFDLFFSVECAVISEPVDWKKEFINEFKARNAWKNNSNLHDEIQIGTPVVSLSRDLIGQVLEVIEQVPSYPKYKILLYKVETEKRELNQPSVTKAIPTGKYIIFPRHLVETCKVQPQLKRGINAYLYFCAERRPLLSGLPFVEMSKQLGQMWSKLTEKEKKPYTKIVKRAKADFAIQKQIYDYCALFGKK